MSLKREINLLATKEHTKPSEDDWVLKMRRRSISIVVVFVLFVLSIFSYAFYLQNRLDSLASEIGAKETEISGMKDLEGLHQILKNKLKSINLITTERSDLTSVLEFLEDTTRFVEESVPEGVILESLEVSTLDKIVLKGRALDPNALQTLISGLTEKELRQYFSEVTLNSLTRAANPDYNFDILLTLVQKKT